jgi:hypothetical protein
LGFWRTRIASREGRVEPGLGGSILIIFRRDLEKLNHGKLGGRFAHPWSFFELLMMIRVIFHLPYRQLEGFLRKLSELIPENQAH